MESGLCDVRFGADVVEVEHLPGAVRLGYRTSGGAGSVTADYVVGCDGASSSVRSALGLPFEGKTYRLRPMLADVTVADHRDALPWPRTELGRNGVTTALRLRPHLWRIIRLDPDVGDGGDPGWADIAPWVHEVLGPGPFEVVWASRFRIHRRAAPTFRQGRVLLAGDAAHVHSPVGGLGMNAGIQDAHNLAWKLAAVLDGGDQQQLLGSYDTERRAVVVETVAGYTELITRLFLQSPRMVRRSLFRALRVALRIPMVHDPAVRRASMLDLSYPPSELLSRDEHRAGVRLPDVVLHDPSGSATRLHDLLPLGAALIDVAEDRDFARNLPVDHVIRVGPGAHHDITGRLRGLLDGADGWLLVRPDRHISWARNHPDGMAQAVVAALGRRLTERS